MVLENIPTWQLILLLVFLFFFLVCGIIIMIVVLGKIRWPVRVTVLEKVPPFGFVPSKRDRARLVAFGDGGEEIYFLKRFKRYRIGYGKKLGKNAIAWGIGQDGYWYNITFGDIDKKLQEVGVLPVERDMRFANSTLRKGIENRYSDKSFAEKWGVTITIGMLVIAIIAQGAGMWFYMDKMLDVVQTQNEGTKLQKEVIELQNSALASISNIREGSGLRPA